MSMTRIRKGVYLLRYYEGKTRIGKKRGKYRQETLKSVTAEEAKRTYQKRTAAAGVRRGHGLDGERMTFEQLADQYLELRGPKMAPRSLERAEAVIELYLKPTFGHMRVEGIRPADIAGYQAKRKKEAKPSTVNREWNVLRAVLNFYEQDLDRVNPIRRGKIKALRIDKREPVFFSPDEWRRFIHAFDDAEKWREYRAGVRKFGPRGAGMKPDSDASNEYLARLRAFVPLFVALLFTGSRLGEILALRWEDVDFRAGRIRMFQEKTREAKTIPLAPPLRSALESMQRGTPKAFVFHDGDGKPWARMAVQRAFEAAKGIAKLRPELTPHKLRHTFASWLVMNGKPLATVQKLLGHSDVKTTMKYAHLSPAHMAGALDQLESIAAETWERPEESATGIAPASSKAAG